MYVKNVGKENITMKLSKTIKKNMLNFLINAKKNDKVTHTHTHTYIHTYNGLGRPPTLLRTATSNVLWKAVLRQLGPAFARRIPPQEADDVPEVLQQHSQRSTSDFGAWRAMLAISFPHMYPPPRSGGYEEEEDTCLSASCPPQRSRAPRAGTISPLEAAAVEIAKIEAQLDEEELERRLVCVREREREAGPLPFPTGAPCVPRKVIYILYI